MKEEQTCQGIHQAQTAKGTGRCVCVVCTCVGCCRSLGWLMLGRCQVGEISWRICSSSQRKVSAWIMSISDGLWCWIFKECRFSSRKNVPVPPAPHTFSHFLLPLYSPLKLHQFCQMPPIPPPQLWGSSASRLTVSMWQSSLKWKRSRKPGVCASFARLGFQPLLSVCQRLKLWTKAFETLPDSAASDCRASSPLRRTRRRFGDLVKEFQQILGTCGEKKRANRSDGVEDLSRSQLQDRANVLRSFSTVTSGSPVGSRPVGHVGLACASSVTQFDSDLCDFSRQSRYFNNAPVKKKVKLHLKKV